MYEMIIVGAGPAGISMAAEARNVGVSADQILVLEKARRTRGRFGHLPGVQSCPGKLQGN